MMMAPGYLIANHTGWRLHCCFVGDYGCRIVMWTKFVHFVLKNKEIEASTQPFWRYLDINMWFNMCDTVR